MAIQQWNEIGEVITVPGTPPASGVSAESATIALPLGPQFASVQYVRRGGTWDPGEFLRCRLLGTSVPPDDPDHDASFVPVPGGRADVFDSDAAVYAGNGDLIVLLPYRYLRVQASSTGEAPDDGEIQAIIRSVFEIGA